MTDFTFPKKFRLLTGDDFLYLQKDAFILKSSSARIYWKKSKHGLVETRVGMSISRKVGKACLRNRLKRIFREYFRNSKLKYLGIDAHLSVYPDLYKKTPQKKLAEQKYRESLKFLFEQLGRECTT